MYRETFLEKLELALEWEEEPHCTAHWQLFCRVWGGVLGKRVRTVGIGRPPPPIMQFPQLCNTTLETLTGSEGKTLFLWESGGEEVLAWAPGDLVRNNSAMISI